MKVVDLHWRLTFQEEAMLAMGKCLSLHCWKCNPNTKIGSGAILGRIILKACFYGSNGYMRQADLDAWGWPEWYWEDSEFVGNGVHVHVHHVHVQENNGYSILGQREMVLFERIIICGWYNTSTRSYKIRSWVFTCGGNVLSYTLGIWLLTTLV